MLFDGVMNLVTERLVSPVAPEDPIWLESDTVASILVLEMVWLSPRMVEDFAGRIEKLFIALILVVTR